jgi:hypothetical protein
LFLRYGRFGRQHESCGCVRSCWQQKLSYEFESSVNMKNQECNKIHFRLWRFVEFEVSGKDAILAGKPYMYFGAVFSALLFMLLYSAQSSGVAHLVSLLTP